MGAAMVGMAMHGGVCPWAARSSCSPTTCGPSVRLAALSRAKCMFVFTHDSVGVGEDGPTHQPIEHLAALRAMPGLRLIRPADANETATRLAGGARRRGAHRAGAQPPVGAGARGHRRRPRWPGAPTCSTATTTPRWSSSAPAARCSVCVDAAATLRPSGRRARVVSMPVLGPVRRPARRLPGAVLPPRRPPALGRGRHHLRLGPLGRPLRRASTASAPRPRATWSSRKLGITADHVWPRRTPCPPDRSRPRTAERHVRSSR